MSQISIFSSEVKYMINEKQARKYCKEDISKIKNYEKAIADTTKTWQCHVMGRLK